MNKALAFIKGPGLFLLIMENITERISAGLLAIVSMVGNLGAERILHAPQWQLCTQIVAMLVGLVSMTWMIYQMTRKRKKKND